MSRSAAIFSKRLLTIPPLPIQQQLPHHHQSLHWTYLSSNKARHGPTSHRQVLPPHDQSRQRRRDTSFPRLVSTQSHSIWSHQGRYHHLRRNHHHLSKHSSSTLHSRHLSRLEICHALCSRRLDRSQRTTMSPRSSSRLAVPSSLQAWPQQHDFSSL